MDPRYEKLRAALRELGEIPLREPPGGWEEYALHQRAACVATHAARLEAVAETQRIRAASAAAPQDERKATHRCSDCGATWWHDVAARQMVTLIEGKSGCANYERIAAAAPLGAPVARLDEEMKRLQLIEKEARDLDARLTELWDLLPEGSHEDAPFSSSAVAWWGLHKALGCCTPETPTPFAFPEKPSPASDPSPDALRDEALDALEALLGWQTLAPGAEVDKARAVLRRGGRHD